MIQTERESCWPTVVYMPFLLLTREYTWPCCKWLLQDHIFQLLQFYKTTMGSDLNMSMLLLILCFLCLVRLMPSGRKRSHHSYPKINLHPRRKKIQYLMSCSVWSAKILWQMLWLSPAVEIATVMSVSVCTNKYKKVKCFWPFESLQSFGRRYSNVFAGVWWTCLPYLQTIRCISWCIDREQILAPSKKSLS